MTSMHATQASPRQLRALGLLWKAMVAARRRRSCDGPVRLERRDENLFERQRFACQRFRRPRFQARRHVGRVAVDDDFDLTALAAQHVRAAEIDRARVVGESRVDFLIAHRARRPRRASARRVRAR